jgi:hypothetical protein
VFARLLDRLTYANVVATLALFVALGGSAYAVAKIGSKQVKNRSLKAIDHRRNALGGKEINESKLGPVPRATAADDAARAQQAQEALNAVNAGLATVATNAEQLGGQQPAFFEKSSRTQFGRRSASPASDPTAFDWPEAGFVIKISAQGGCADPDHVTLRFENTRASGSPDLQVFTGTGSNFAVSPGSNSISCSGVDGRWEGAAVVPDSGRTLFFDCRRLASDVRCLGTRSEP